MRNVSADYCAALNERRALAVEWHLPLVQHSTNEKDEGNVRYLRSQVRWYHYAGKMEGASSHHIRVLFLKVESLLEFLWNLC